MTSRSSVYCISGLVAAAVAAAIGARAVRAPHAAAHTAGWTLAWTRIDPAAPVRAFSMDSAGVVRRVINAGPAGVLDTVPRPLVWWAARSIDRAALCTMTSSEADLRVEVSLTVGARTCAVARGVPAWRGDPRGRRVLAVVDSLEKVACRTRCSPFE